MVVASSAAPASVLTTRDTVRFRFIVASVRLSANVHAPVLHIQAIEHPVVKGSPSACYPSRLKERSDMLLTPRIQLALGTAVVLVAVAVAGCSRSAQSHLDRGDAYLKQGKIDAAVLEFRGAVQKDPMLAPARLKLADAYLRQGNGAGAFGEYVRAADLLPKDADAQLKAGSLLLMAGRAEEAKARADKALALNGKNVNALVLRANALAGLKDLDGALAQMQQARGLIDFAAGQHDGRDRRAARVAARMQCRRRLQLGAQIGRGIEQHPVLAVSRNGEARLGAWLDAFVAGPGEAANRTSAIPLRKASTRRGTDNDGGKAAQTAPHSRGLQKRVADQNSAGR
jgi:tetratricopeptide (TPR) repeat protein